MTINDLFNLLDDWKKLPGYQLERRADIFFGLHLKMIFDKVLGEKVDEVIPEFPIRKGSLPFHEKFNIDPDKRGNQSYKIDYLAYSKNKNLVYFIELKTDIESRNEKQDWYLTSANKIGAIKILEDLKEIYKASNSKGRAKYKYLLKKLFRLNWISKDDISFEILNKNIRTKIIYIQPTSKLDDDSIITFNKIYKKLKPEKEPLTQRFLESLKKWELDTINKK